jgi:hypothetical protein
MQAMYGLCCCYVRWRLQRDIRTRQRTSLRQDAANREGKVPLAPHLLRSAPFKCHAVLGAPECVQHAPAHQVCRMAPDEVAPIAGAQRRHMRLQFGLRGAVEA